MLTTAKLDAYNSLLLCVLCIAISGTSVWAPVASIDEVVVRAEAGNLPQEEEKPTRDQPNVLPPAGQYQHWTHAARGLSVETKPVTAYGMNSTLPQDGQQNERVSCNREAPPYNFTTLLLRVWPHAPPVA